MAVRSGNGGEEASDEVYGVVSVLYHSLQGVEACIQYFEDAQDANDDELAEFFEMCRFEQSKRAEKAKILLAERLEQVGIPPTKKAGRDRALDNGDDMSEDEDEAT